MLKISEHSESINATFADATCAEVEGYGVIAKIGKSVNVATTTPPKRVLCAFRVVRNSLSHCRSTVCLVFLLPWLVEALQAYMCAQ